MRILLSSHLFYPSVGGIEQVTAMLADGFMTQGHDVRVVTQTLTHERDHLPYEVFRQPLRRQLLSLVKWCDVFLHNNISLGTAWPLLLVRRPWVIGHQTWITREDGSVNWQDRLKKFLVRFATNIAVSQALADSLPTSSAVIGNPYRDNLFRRLKGVNKDRELVFLGRLVSDKGVDLLIEALGRLKAEGLQPGLTVIGIGPELEALRELAERHGVTDQVNFEGLKQNAELAGLLNRHQILVAPSRWHEPFGIVALEGIACGCVVVGSECGGLKDAIGACGRTFENGNAVQLGNILSDLLRHPGQLAAYRANSAKHLNGFKLAVVAKSYLDVLHKEMEKRRRT